MKPLRWMLTGLSLTGLFLLSACSGGFTTSMYGYHGYRDHSPFWGHHDYYRDRVAVVPPGGIDPPPGAIDPPEAVTLPEPPPDMPDMGMPDIEIEPFD